METIATQRAIEREEKLIERNVIGIRLKRNTFIRYNQKKNDLEKMIGKKLSHDDFMNIIMFLEKKFILHKRKKTIEINNQPVMTL